MHNHKPRSGFEEIEKILLIGVDEIIEINKILGGNVLNIGISEMGLLLQY